MAVMTPPPPQSMLNQGETFDDLPFVAENSTFCPGGNRLVEGHPVVGRARSTVEPVDHHVGP